LNLKRRNFIQLSTLVAGSAMAAGFQSIPTTGGNARTGKGTDTLKIMTRDIIPISVTEREERVAKAQQLLLQNKIEALVLESGTALEYFTGISWWPSERTMVVVIPANGEIKYICPAFEEARFHELITIGKKIYTWQEDESPYQLIALSFVDSGIHKGTIGVEEETRFFIFDGIRKAAPHLNYVSADPVTIPCRMIKSAAELSLMQMASDITVAAM
jgi:Xaa-Pro dipeptidase